MHWTTSFPRCGNARAGPAGLSTRFLGFEAAKARPLRGRRIAVDAESHDGSVVIRVRDDGIGIPADMVDRVFEMFTQADRSAARQHGGLGIGLSLVRGLVEAHGGSVRVVSAGPGAGTEILVRLPVQEAGIPAVQAAG